MATVDDVAERTDRPVYEVVPIERQHFQGFHRALDSVARERRYLAMLEAPSFTRTRRFVLDSLRDGAVHVVALAGGEVVGWCDLRPKSAVTLRHSAVLGMGIVQEHRGRGLGARMLADTLYLAEQRGLCRAELIVRADNAPAIALYRRFGFDVEGTCRRYMRVDGVDYDALVMARLLDRGSAPAVLPPGGGYNATPGIQHRGRRT